MLNEKMEEALNDQLNWEFFSAYLYASMSAYFSGVGLSGFANWMRVQALEELTHAGKFFDFIGQRGGKVRLASIAQPPWTWASPLEAFEDALAHEQKVTSRINALVETAREQRDHASEIFLQWFVTEQVEEETSVTEVIQKLRLVGDHPASLFHLDVSLGSRVFVMPAGKTGQGKEETV